jgi:hypothetical protein
VLVLDDAAAGLPVPGTPYAGNTGETRSLGQLNYPDARENAGFRAMIAVPRGSTSMSGECYSMSGKRMGMFGKAVVAIVRVGTP